MRINDQSAAIKLAICDDIGERSYIVAEVAAILVQMLTRLPNIGMLSFPIEIITFFESFFLQIDVVWAGVEALQRRYKIQADGRCGKTYVLFCLPLVSTTFLFLFFQ